MEEGIVDLGSLGLGLLLGIVGVPAVVLALILIKRQRAPTPDTERDD